jgi:L-alanine-DL-glutamate epimerase-like enolase superfamily enzyme
MAITDFTTTYLDIPLPADFFPSWIPGRPQSHNRCVVLEVHDDSGHVGVAASTCFEQQQGEVVKYIAVDLIGRFLIGADPFEIEKHAKLVTRFAMMFGGRPWLMECALWDLMAKIAGQPLYKLLGGARDRIPVYCSFGESVLVKGVEARKRAVDARLAEGFRAFKLRSRSVDYRDDIRLMEAIRDHVGDDVDLMIDCNQGWNLSPLGAEWSYEETREFCRAAESLDFAWVEEPRHRFDFEGLSRLCIDTDITIAGGELNQGLHEFKLLLDRDCLDKLQPDVTLAGGISMARKVATLCEARDKSFSPHTWTNGIGLLLNLHLACGVSNCHILEYPYEEPGWVPEARDAMLVEPVRPRDGVIEVPSGPGIGVELDRDAMEKYGTRL